MSVCGGKATSFNLTANFCSDNVTAATTIIHGAHLFDVTTVGVFLGNQTFTSCEALNATSTSSTGAPVATFKGGVSRLEVGGALMGLAGLVAAALL